MLPVITISRQFGSGGHEVGERLARELNVPFYDKALIAMAAKQSGLSEEVFANADEKATSSLLYSMVMGSYSFGARVPGINEMPINDKLFIIQSDIIKKAAAEGPCVVIGRCADYILRGKFPTLNVFIHSEMPYKIDRSVEEHSLERERAASILTRRDKARAHHYRFYTDQKWGDAKNYDLCLDSGRLGIDTCVELIKDTYGRLNG